MSKKYSIGLASFGMSGRVFHAPILSQHDGFHLAAIVERTASSSAVLYPSVRVCRSFEELIGISDLDVVVVNTPDLTHTDYVRKALDSGKHVVVEKPFTVTSADARLLIDIARQRGKILSVFHNRRWDGDFLTVREIINSGRLGRVVEFVSHYDRFRPEVPLDSWKEQSGLGSGILYNLGSHMIDQAIVLFGMPEAVTAHLGRIRENAQVDDWYEIRLHYPNLKVRLNGSMIVRQAGPRYRIEGTKGSFTKFGIDPQEEKLKNGVVTPIRLLGIESEESYGTISVDGGSNTIPVKTVNGNYSIYYDLLYNSLDNSLGLGTPPPVTGEDGLNTIHIIEAAIHSHFERMTVNLRV